MTEMILHSTSKHQTVVQHDSVEFKSVFMQTKKFSRSSPHSDQISIQIYCRPSINYHHRILVVVINYRIDIIDMFC